MSNNLNRLYIQDYPSLITLCEKLSKAEFLAIDTEFVRTRTLYPKLGLLQINDGENLALIDPIAISDLTPFWQLLTNEKICKVLHACSEDLEVFLSAANCKPVNLIDSQIMMMFLGHGLSIGYAAMIKHYLDIELDKSESRTDWTKRPLTGRQLTYAQADVEFLFQIYPRLLKETENSGWLAAAKQESQQLIDKKFTPIDKSSLYQNIKMSWKLNAQQLNLLKHLAIWRFELAQKKDQPIGFIAKDHTLFGLAKCNPKTVGAMQSIEGVEYLDIKHKGKAMLNVLTQANEVPKQDYPNEITRLDEYPGYKQIFKKVKSFVALCANAEQQLPENLASKKQINQFLTWHFKLNQVDQNTESVDILKNWRLPLFGEKLRRYAENNFSN